MCISIDDCILTFLLLWSMQCWKEKNIDSLQIREDARKGVYVENLTEYEVSSARDVMQQLIQVWWQSIIWLDEEASSSLSNFYNQ